jgi:osmotically-inducible protein OsmY
LLTDTPMTDAVIGSIESDPRIPQASEIAVSADGGILTLRGTVESFAQRRAAGQDAKDIEGVYEVDNQLKVNLPGSDRREDDEIRGAAIQNLVWDAEVPADAVDVKVDTGWVTLKGDVSYQYQSDAAYDDVATMYGVYGITNEIRVTNP